MQPVLFDFESQSAANLPVVGGRKYAAHPSTRVLCLCCLIDGTFHLWLPDMDIGLPVFRDLWPYQFGAARPLALWTTPDGSLPSVIADAVGQGRQFVAHNCDLFDKHVWAAKVKPLPQAWGDTIHACRAAGLPAGLAKLGERFFGHGKDAGNVIMRKMMTLEWFDGRWFNRHTTPGNVAAAARYCVADVVILEKVWQEVGASAEPAVIDTNNRINERGVQLDVGLADTLVQLSDAAANRAGDEVERLTGGALAAADLRSVVKVKKWIMSRGLRLDSLNKAVVQRLLDEDEAFVREMLDEDDSEGGLPQGVCDSETPGVGGHRGGLVQQE